MESLPSNSIDIVRDMDDLYGFDNNSVSAIYTRYARFHSLVVSVIRLILCSLVLCFDCNGSSHTLEHNAFGDGSLDATLQGIVCFITDIIFAKFG